MARPRTTRATKTTTKAKPPFEVVTADKFFKPQVAIVPTRDIWGWITEKGDRGNKRQVHPTRPKKFQFKSGQVVYVDEATAREFIAKGYATGELKKPLSDDEIAEFRSEVTTIGLGQEASNG